MTTTPATPGAGGGVRGAAVAVATPTAVPLPSASFLGKESLEGDRWGTASTESEDCPRSADLPRKEEGEGGAGGGAGGRVALGVASVPGLCPPFPAPSAPSPFR